MAPVPYFKLNTGATAPAIGLGCWAGFEQKDRDASKQWILSALKAGYRRIDTAWFYGTEQAVGEAIKESGIPREEIFVVTKLSWHHAYGREEEGINSSLERLGLEYVDLWLMHWPQAVLYENNDPLPKDENGNLKINHEADFRKTWAAMEKIYQSGKARAIGVSNFSIKNLEILLKDAKVTPADNQIELHPYLVQEELVQYCQSRGIAVTAYAPTGYATVRADPTIVALAEKYGASPAQVILAWHVARGVHAMPCSKDPAHQAQNIDLPVLAPADVARISALDKGKRLCNAADENGKVNGWTLEQLGW
ncbi:aldo/keto reductase [Phanerochaete sordida]|uniref:Aldo/keto reductase n=1 Tax=Phanerochaete sordida TaxID=48140 RepID=A0A9P3FYL6_9APHY|nr:aldo/keto reductase [Phanerochaete sordida]